MSVVDPAAKGQIRVTGFAGKSAAMAGKARIHKRVMTASTTILLFAIFILLSINNFL
jgi:hypothetical protein